MKVGRERRSSRQRRSGKAHRRRIIILIAVLVAIPIVAAGIFGVVLSFGLRTVAAVENDIPALQDQHQVSLAQTSAIYASDGTLLAYLHGIENRTVISGKQIPQVLRNAVVAIEDERFYSHPGVDLESVVRALVTNVKAQHTTEGFSTITMQLVGNLYLDRTDLSFRRKFDEMALAYQLERKYSKNEILDLYLNTVYFGSNAYGVEAAAKTYFNKEPADLTLPEAALIAGLPQAPTGFSPRKHPDEALTRRNMVIQSMADNGFITPDEAENALLTGVELAPYSPYTQVQEPYVVAYVRKQLIDMFGEEKVFEGGLQVETTIDPAYQKLATDAITSTLNQPGDPSSALVSIQADNGYIRAMVGGTDYDTSEFNLASQGRRQPGSAFKTFCLTAAIEMGINPSEVSYLSMPLALTYPGATTPWKVSTFGNKYYGLSTILQATLRSDNTVYAQLALDVGADRIVDTAHRMGITSTLNANPAIVLGGLTYGVSPLEMASAYGTLANGGQNRADDHHPDQGFERQGDLEGQSQAHPGHLGRGGLRRHQHPPAEHPERHRHQGQHRPPGRREDRHRPRVRRRLVLRIHPPPFHQRVGGLPPGPDRHEGRPRQQCHRGRSPGPDMAEIHECGRPGLPRGRFRATLRACEIRSVLP